MTPLKTDDDFLVDPIHSNINIKFTHPRGGIARQKSGKDAQILQHRPRVDGDELFSRVSIRKLHEIIDHNIHSLS